MKFKTNTSDLLKAIDLVSIVTPRQVTPQGGAGYLFLVRGERCYVYSRDSVTVARADFPITDVEGEGSFVYPSQYIDALRYVGSSLSVETEEGEDRWLVKYEDEMGASGERLSFDPQLLSTCDKDLEKTTTTYDFPAGILREAINMSRPFLVKPQDPRTEEYYKGLLIFDQSKPEWAKGDGYLYASNSIQSFYFQCEQFAGKHLEVHGQYLPALTAFLAKCEGTVTVRRGDNFTFVTDSQGHVFGWPKQAKTHGKFNYYALKSDQYVFSIPKAQLVNGLKYARVSLDKNRDKIKVSFDHERKTLQFGVADGSVKAQSLPIRIEDDSQFEEKSQVWNVNIDHLLSLIESMRSNVVQLRVAVIKHGDKDLAMIRTIDTFRMTAEGKVVNEPENSYECRVTRFMPSKD
jgi:hypothetical protein